MGRILRYVSLLVAALLWLGGCARPVALWLTDLGLVQSDYRYGDLYRLANLPQFRDPQPECPAPALARPTARTHLYVIGDSFAEAERISGQEFPVSHYHYVHWAQQHRVQLDTTKRNVLLLESVERHLREHLAQPVRNVVVVPDTLQADPAAQKPSWGRQLADLIQSKGIEERLETVLFSHDLFMWVKEQKAALTLRWFDRHSPKVALSRDQRHIFINLDTDTSTINSSFTPLPDNELNRMVDSLNATHDRYRALGFDAVYLSVIPNKVSVVAPTEGHYNRLIERLQRHPNLRVPVVDIYTTYRQQPQRVYALGDSHWTCHGRSLWLNVVNQTLFSARN